MDQFMYNDFKAKIRLQQGVTNTGRNINSGECSLEDPSGTWLETHYK